MSAYATLRTEDAVIGGAWEEFLSLGIKPYSQHELAEAFCRWMPFASSPEVPFPQHFAILRLFATMVAQGMIEPHGAWPVIGQEVTRG